jgi:hypothetical protein
VYFGLCRLVPSLEQTARQSFAGEDIAFTIVKLVIPVDKGTSAMLSTSTEAEVALTT